MPATRLKPLPVHMQDRRVVYVDLDDLEPSCGGKRYLHCYCGGDLCCCGLNGGLPCPGCEDCEPDVDWDAEDQ